MLSIIYSDWYYGVGKLYKSDGVPYRTSHGAFRNHPCTQWAAANQYNLAWLIAHGIALCHEYTARYHKRHTCHDVIRQALVIYTRCFSHWPSSQAYRKVTSFTRAMPESIKFDTTIDTITAYKQYLNTKPWLATNYLRIPSRKPSFIITTMQTVSSKDINYNDDIIDLDALTPSQQQQAKSLEKAMAAADATKGLVPAPKKAKRGGKAGRIVGISADENKYIQDLLQFVSDDPHFGSSNPNYAKIQARYNK
tara:strand:+ start:290 stop:1042 length:753 start_codon:yes stop_codon:yes gene_type:complete